MIILDRLLFGGLTFVLRRLADAVDAELNDTDTLREAHFGQNGRGGK